MLLVDFDPQGALSAGLGVNPHELGPDGLQRADGPQGQIPTPSTRPAENVDLLPANIDLSAAEVQLVNVALEQVLDRALKKVEDDYDVVLIDCQPPGPADRERAHRGARRHRPADLRVLRPSAALLVETIDKVQDRLNPRLQVDGCSPRCTTPAPCTAVKSSPGWWKLSGTRSSNRHQAFHQVRRRHGGR